jgi:hypothetical protein
MGQQELPRFLLELWIAASNTTLESQTIYERELQFLIGFLYG